MSRNILVAVPSTCRHSKISFEFQFQAWLLHWWGKGAHILHLWWIPPSAMYVAGSWNMLDCGIAGCLCQDSRVCCYPTTTTLTTLNSASIYYIDLQFVNWRWSELWCIHLELLRSLWNHGQSRNPRSTHKHNWKARRQDWFSFHS